MAAHRCLLTLLSPASRPLHASLDGECLSVTEATYLHDPNRDINNNDNCLLDNPKPFNVDVVQVSVTHKLSIDLSLIF